LFNGFCSAADAFSRAVQCFHLRLPLQACLCLLSSGFFAFLVLLSPLLSGRGLLCPVSSPPPSHGSLLPTISKLLSPKPVANHRSFLPPFPATPSLSNSSSSRAFKHDMQVFTVDRLCAFLSPSCCPCPLVLRLDHHLPSSTFVKRFLAQSWLSYFYPLRLTAPLVPLRHAWGLPLPPPPPPSHFLFIGGEFRDDRLFTSAPQNFAALSSVHSPRVFLEFFSFVLVALFWVLEVSSNSKDPI